MLEYAFLIISAIIAGKYIAYLFQKHSEKSYIIERIPNSEIEELKRKWNTPGSVVSLKKFKAVYELYKAGLVDNLTILNSFDLKKPSNHARLYVQED